MVDFALIMIVTAMTTQKHDDSCVLSHVFVGPFASLLFV